MHELVLFAGFFGAWLLVIGPVLQAVLELEEEEAARERFLAISAKVPVPERTSPWWWLLPPLYLWLERGRRLGHRNALVEAMTDDDRAVLSRFMNKARGWLYVAVGASLIAFKETYELVHGMEWPDELIWLLAAVMLGLGAGNAVARQLRADRALSRR